MRPVRFADQVRAMADAGVDVFVEVGPGRVLTDLVEQTLQGRPHTALRLDDQDGALVGEMSVRDFTTIRRVIAGLGGGGVWICLLYTSPSPRDRTRSRMPSSA